MSLNSDLTELVPLLVAVRDIGKPGLDFIMSFVWGGSVVQTAKLMRGCILRVEHFIPASR